jgi:prepilin-type N-terminal cleavage/methylation domain-containing protein
MHPRTDHRGFSLVEVLLVLALLALLAGAALQRTSRSSATELEAGQALLVHLLDAARTRALAAGTATRLLVNHDLATSAAGERCLRRILVQERRSTVWRTVSATSLPSGVRLLPGNAAVFAEAFDGSPGAWLRGDGAPLRSTALRGNASVVAREEDGPAETWIALTLSELGTTFSTGDLVLASVRWQPPASAPGGWPFRFVAPDQVRGVSVGAQGIVFPIHDRLAF